MDEKKMRIDILKEHYKASRDDIRSLRTTLFSFLPVISIFFAFIGGSSFLQQVKTYSVDLVIVIFLLLLAVIVSALRVSYWLISRIISTELSILSISHEMDKLIGFHMTEKAFGVNLMRRSSNFAWVTILGCVLAGIPVALILENPAMQIRLLGVSFSTVFAVISVLIIVGTIWMGLADLIRVVNPNSLSKASKEGGQ